MADRLQYEDVADGAGCRHGVEGDAKRAIRRFLLTRPALTFTLAQSSTVLAQLVAYLQQEVPLVTWTPRLAIRAIRAMVEDEEE